MVCHLTTDGEPVSPPVLDEQSRGGKAGQHDNLADREGAHGLRLFAQLRRRVNASRDRVRA
jgi:hypothetical protein